MAETQDLPRVCVPHVTLTHQGGPRGRWSRTPGFSQVMGRQVKGLESFAEKGLFWFLKGGALDVSAKKSSFAT